MGPWSCSKDPKVHLYLFLDQLDHFPQTRYNFHWKFVFKMFCRVGKKMTFFQTKIGQFLTEISEILEINKNHLNTPNCQILGHLKHFGPKNGHLGHFWVIFGPINLYRNLPARRHTPSHVIGHNF